MTGHTDDSDWRPPDPAKLDDIRQGLGELDDANGVRRLEEAVATALRATAGERFDPARLWDRLERSLQADQAPGEGQTGEESTPGR